MTAPSPLPRRVIRILRGPCIASPRWAEHGRMFDRAYLLVQLFYALSLVKLYSAAPGLWPLEGLQNMDLLWPVWWLDAAGAHLGGMILANLMVIAGFAGLLLWRFAAVRVLVSLALLERAAMALTHGSMSHGNHEWFWISVCFWFLPAGSYQTLNAARAARMQFVLTVGAATTLILMFYSMSGLWKCSVALAQLVQGGFGGFSPLAMATTVARRALQTNSHPLWGWIVLDHPLLGWPLYIGLYYVELVAIFVAFRPALLKLWGAVLILFHIGTFTFLDIIFPDHILIDAMFFLFAPFAIERPDPRSVAAALPGLGIAVRRLTGWSAGGRFPGQPRAAPAE